MQPCPHTRAQAPISNANNPSAGDEYFGNAVSLDADTLAVGAPDEDSDSTAIVSNENDVPVGDSYNNVGAVYVYREPSLPSAGISGDPHLRGAHGEEADIKGEQRGVYNVLSARNLSLNLLMENQAFRTTHSKLRVNGSWVRATFHTVRTIRTGRLLQVRVGTIPTRTDSVAV